LETLVLPSRVADYIPALLDELCSAGEVVWAGAGSLPGNDGWVRLVPADAATLLLPDADAEMARTPLHETVLDALADGAALFFRDLANRTGSTDDATLLTALWDLVWAGELTNDTVTPLRARLSGRAAAARSSRGSRPRPMRSSRYGRYRGLAPGRPAMPSRTGPPSGAGRWWRLPDREPQPTRRMHATAEALLDRYGVLTRGAVAAEGTPGGFAAVYPVLSAFEDAGRCRRGYFVEGLGAAQFAVPGAVDRMRSLAATSRPAETPLWTAPVPPSWEQGRRRPKPESSGALVLAATDPANPYGAALPWPEREAEGGHRPGRKAGALVVLLHGALVLYVERGGKTLLSFRDDEDALQPAADALALAVRGGALGKLSVEKADGEAVLVSDLGKALEAAGFRPTPRGLRLRR
jgi:ATP-dependent Lhr-like helicase